MYIHSKVEVTINLNKILYSRFQCWDWSCLTRKQYSCAAIQLFALDISIQQRPLVDHDEMTQCWSNDSSSSLLMFLSSYVVLCVGNTHCFVRLNNLIFFDLCCWVLVQTVWTHQVSLHICVGRYRPGRHWEELVVFLPVQERLQTPLFFVCFRWNSKINRMQRLAVLDNERIFPV